MNVYPSFPWNVAMLLPNCSGSQTVQSGVRLLPKLSSTLDWTVSLGREGKLGSVFHDTSHHELTFHKI